MFKDKILNRKEGILLYGLTPPKQDSTPEKLAEIADKQIQRINALPIDGLILYDIQDEASRTNIERPFPYMATLDPQEYREQYLRGCRVASINYKCVGKHTPDTFVKWLQQPVSGDTCSVFVGAASREQSVSLSMKQAYQLKKQYNNELVVGGVTIPERHIKKGDEHLRIFDKMQSGCQFFISQCVYHLEASKDLISDLYYHAADNGLPLVPVIFTLTPCGSLKTLQFMEWLGISIPRWLKNDLARSGDILNKSIDICKSIAEELMAFCHEKNIPAGFNIESIAIRKAEIDASVELLHFVKGLFQDQQSSLFKT